MSSSPPPLRVYDRFASASPEPVSFASPITTNAKSKRASVLGAWSSFPPSSASVKSGKTNNNLNSETIREEEPPLPPVPQALDLSRTHKREESELTRAPYLSTAQTIHSLKESTSSFDILVAANAAVASAAVASTASPANANINNSSRPLRRDKASQVLGIPHRSSMEPIPARKPRNSMMSTRSAGNQPPSPSFTPTLPLASLYVVSGLPKRPQTWTLADPDAVQGLTHSDGAVNRWWRAEVLGSTVSPGVGGGKKKKVMKGHTTQTEISKGPGALTKQETAKMLSKALKVCYFRL